MKQTSLLFREKQHEILNNFFHSKRFLNKNIFIYGSSGTGKTNVVDNVLSSKSSKLHHIRIDASDFTSAKNVNIWNTSVKLVLELIISKFANQFEYSKKLQSISSFNDFLHQLQVLFCSRSPENESFVIVFDSAEKFLKIKLEIFQFFYKLPEMIESYNFCTAFVSNLPPHYFYSNTFYITPLSIEFPRYTNSEIAQILLNEKPHDADEKLYNTFIEIFLKVCLPVTNNIGELSSLCKMNFEEYLEKSQAFIDSDVWTQWKVIQPVLKRSLTKIHARYKTASDHQAIAVNQLEMPLMTRYMLIAAFIASYNLSGTDKKYFVQNAGKLSSRTKRLEKKAERTENRFAFPKVFPLDRLVGIYRSITALEELPFTVMAQSQINSLCKLGLITNGSTETASSMDSGDKLMIPKYRCLASFELVESIAKPINFNLRAYLTDFA